MGGGRHPLGNISRDPNTMLSSNPSSSPLVPTYKGPGVNICRNLSMDLQSLALSVAIDCSTFSPVDNGETSALRYLFLRDDAILTP